MTEEAAAAGTEVEVALTPRQSRMYRLFSRVPEGLNPIASIVRQHIEHMGNEIINRREAKLEGGEKDTNQDGFLTVEERGTAEVSS